MIIVLPSVLGTIIFLLVSILVYAIKHPEIVDKWSYIYNKYKIQKDIESEKKVISKNMDYKITKLSRIINKESQGILPFGVRIKWRNTDTVESYIKKNDVIVILKKEDNCDKNIVDTCMAYIPKALLPKARNCIDLTVLKTIDLFMIRKLLNSGTYDSAYNYYLNNVYNVHLAKDNVLSKYIDTIDKLNKIGFFTRILLEEYRLLGKKLYGTDEEQGFHQESIEFLTFLKRIAERQPGEYTRLQYCGDRINIALVFVAKRGTYIKGGIDAYVDRIDKDINKGAQRLFILSYAQWHEEIKKDSDGHVVAVKRRKNFIKLNALEKKCKSKDNIRLLVKHRYKTRDVTGHNRSAKCLIYEIIR